MRQLNGRVAIVGGAVILAVLCLLFPPWRARAIRTTTRYAAVRGVEPATVLDTISWSLSFEPLFAPPRAPLSAMELRRLAERAASGDVGARTVLRRAMDPFEQKYNAPEVIRTSGELWRDSVLAAAGVPAASSYEANFWIDNRWLAARLVALVAIASLVDYRRRRRRRIV